MFKRLYACWCACLLCLCLFWAFGVVGVSLWLFQHWCGARGCVFSSGSCVLLGCSFVFGVCASFVVGASAVVWGDWLLRRNAFSRDCGFRRGVVLFPVCAVCCGLGRWFVAGLVRVCACVVGSRVFGGQVVCAHELYESSRGNKVDGLPRAASIRCALKLISTFKIWAIILNDW